MLNSELTKTVIMIDHGGVLDETTRYVTDAIPRLRRDLAIHYSVEQVEEIIKNKKIRETDFVLPTRKAEVDESYGDTLDQDSLPVMPNGSDTIRMLNWLVENGAILVFHSKNVEADQVHLLKQLDNAIHEHNRKTGENLQLPRFSAMVVGLDKKSNGHTATAPRVYNSEFQDITVLEYTSNSDQELTAGKAEVRQAIVSHFNIKDPSRHFVLDDGRSNVEAAQLEGFNGLKISSQLTTLEALTHIQAQILEWNMAEHGVTQVGPGQLDGLMIDDPIALAIAKVPSGELSDNFKGWLSTEKRAERLAIRKALQNPSLSTSEYWDTLKAEVQQQFIEESGMQPTRQLNPSMTRSSPIHTKVNDKTPLTDTPEGFFEYFEETTRQQRAELFTKIPGLIDLEQDPREPEAFWGNLSATEQSIYISEFLESVASTSKSQDGGCRIF